MKRTTSLLLALLLIFSLAACGAKEEAPASAASDETAAEAPVIEAADEKKVLRIGTIDASQSFRPIDAGLPGMLAYEHLTNYTPGGGQEMWLATSIEWLDDTTLQIKLRDDVYFANGEPLTGEDVIYSFYYQATSMGNPLAEKYQCIDFDASYVSEDGLTVTLILKEVFSVLDVWIPKVPIIEKGEAENRASDDPQWWDMPITSAAYQIVENIDGSHVTFARRDDYWNKDNIPQWDEITFYYYSNATAMFIAFENEELDIATKIDYKDYDRAVAGDVSHPDSTKTIAVNPYCAMFVCLGGYCEYFEDINVRKAIAHALEPESLATVGFGSLYTAGLDSAISPAFSAYAPQGSYEYDPELAKEYMAKSAYPDGFELHMIGEIANTTIAEVLQAQLAEIGITLTVDIYDFPTMISHILVPGSSDIGLWGGGSLASYDAYDIISPFHDENGLTVSRILDPEYNAMYDQITKITDEEQRNAVYADMQKWIYETCWIIPLFETKYGIVYNSDSIDCSLFDLTMDHVEYSCLPVT